MSNNLSPPGSSVYSSDSMYVGDGTWDSSRNTFLLPNLQGYNLATTQYNGMGNRFRNMVGYKSIILGHGIVAAITFLGIVPAAIIIARFYHRNPRMALRIHIWLQILTVFLSTVVFVLGFEAVGSRRSLTNPHHGIGVAIYTLVLVQAFGGCMIHRLEKGKERYKIPLKLMLHQWIGRAIALLGIAQVALGLTLYGSPKVLFILFGVWGFILLVAYFILSYLNQPELTFDDQGTYITERTGSSRRSRRSRPSRGGHGLGALAAAGAAGAGIAALRKHSRSRSRSRSHSRHRPHGGRSEVLSSMHSSRQSDSYFDDEKYTEDGRKGRGWGERLLGAAAAMGGVAAIRSIFNRKKKPAPSVTTGFTESDVTYSRPLGPSEVTQTDLTRLEEGRAPASPANDRYRRAEESEVTHGAISQGSPLRHGHRPRRGTEDSVSSWDSRTDFTEDPSRYHESHGLRNGIAALGFAGFLKHQWNKRRNRKEDAHVEEIRRQDMEAERLARANSNRRRYTGDGAPPRRGGRRVSSFDESDISGTTPALSRHDIPRPPRTGVTHTETSAGPSNIPLPPPPQPQFESGSESYLSPGGRPHRRHRPGPSAAAGPSSSRREDSRESGVASPPISVKVKMHGDGRSVTLRRLNEEEAAAAREARKREGKRPDRTGSISSVSNFDNERWRRTEAMEAAQAQQMASAPPVPPIPMPEPIIPGPPSNPPPPSGAGSQIPLPPPSGAGSHITHPAPSGAGSHVPLSQPSMAGSHQPFPPPPPMPAVMSGMASPRPSGMSSPLGTGTYGGTETDISNYDSNRRRRRAERAQAKQNRLGGSRVEFS
ncbi:hypothetical protein GQ43DRAFT_443975 [Delitschia confertaspora ATCC 74209]|uniref:Cytochrome b561 domain-containing protein n=1 Tax=Delitschia confertaspora ATCC 74209 TaxID=1513339 RepID=A0A9P4JGV1_9PLEO|nr:hypothetical protein GQ43DRAFT_443975 [Delitschia confertaspora ATCC 74209]